MILSIPCKICICRTFGPHWLYQFCLYRVPEIWHVAQEKESRLMVLCLPEILFQVSESISCCDYFVLLWKPLFENCNNISNFFVLLKFNVFLDTSSVCGVWLMWYWSENVIMLCGPMFNVDSGHSLSRTIDYRITLGRWSLDSRFRTYKCSVKFCAII